MPVPEFLILPPASFLVVPLPTGSHGSFELKLVHLRRPIQILRKVHERRNLVRNKVAEALLSVSITRKQFLQYPRASNGLSHRVLRLGIPLHAAPNRLWTHLSEPKAKY